MKLEKWALISEIVGGIAILATLVILVIELRGNTAAINAASRQSIAARVENLAMQETRRELAEVIEKSSVSRLDPVERRMLFGWIAARLRNGEEAFLQNLDGHLPDEYWLPRSNATVGTLFNEQALEIWDDLKPDFSVDFAIWLDQAIEARYGE